MALRVLHVHQPNALWPIQNGGEGAAMFCWAFLLLVFTGSGAFGLDRLFATALGVRAGARPAAGSGWLPDPSGPRHHGVPLPARPGRGTDAVPLSASGLLPDQGSR